MRHAMARSACNVRDGLHETRSPPNRNSSRPRTGREKRAKRNKPQRRIYHSVVLTSHQGRQLFYQFAPQSEKPRGKIDRWAISGSQTTRGFWATDLAILNLGQVTRTTPELAAPSPNYRTNPTGGRLSPRQ
ncbi:hypothetical protein TNCV_831251 [Trichonephila clavipes]|nr:hypothetical protein TNCV_831251 [Trichonephila clavipes]